MAHSKAKSQSVSKKTKECHSLRDLIRLFGVQMPCCAHYCDRQLECRFTENLSYCSKCVNLVQSYNIDKFSAFKGKWIIYCYSPLYSNAFIARRLIRVKKCLTKEEAEAEAANKQAL